MERITSTERLGRPRERFQRIKTPLHQQELQRIKTQFLREQKGKTIDRETVLKINRLATRKYAHKRDCSWPPTVADFNSGKRSQFDSLGKQSGDQHVRSFSNDNSVHFDKNVCQRHVIDDIREKFICKDNLREQNIKSDQSILNKNTNEQNQIISKNKSKIGSDLNGNDLKEKNSNLRRQYEKRIKDKKNQERQEDNNMQPSNLKTEKIIFHKISKDENNALSHVEPSKHCQKHIKNIRKWSSSDNIKDAVKSTHSDSLLTPCSKNSISSESGQEIKSKPELPPKKPRISDFNVLPFKLKRRSIMMQTGIEICYDSDDELHLKTINKKAVNLMLNDLENMPLPKIPLKCKTLQSDDHSITHLEPNNNGEQKKSDAKMENPVDDLSNTLLQHTNSMNKQSNCLTKDEKCAETIIPHHYNLKILHTSQRYPKSMECKFKCEIEDVDHSKHLKDNIISQSMNTPQRSTKTELVSDVISDSFCCAKNLYSEKEIHKRSSDSPDVAQLANVNFEVKSTFSNDSKSNTCSQNARYYTDGEFLYGPCYSSDIVALSHINIQNLNVTQDCQEKQKDYNSSVPENTQNNNHKATPTLHENNSKSTATDIKSKYENMQKSICEQLIHIEQYIENAKRALQSTIETTKNFRKGHTEALNNIQTASHTYQSNTLPFQNKQMERQDIESKYMQESPLQRIKREVLSTLKDELPLISSNVQIFSISNEHKQSHLPLTLIASENTEIVDKVLESLNLLTLRLRECTPSLQDVNMSC